MSDFLVWMPLFFIAYVYAGYPFLLALAARMRRPARCFPEHLPAVTLLIAAYNEADVIGPRLENALALDYPDSKLQILVAADGSDDETAAIVARYADRGVTLNYQPERQGKMAAINRALPNARGEIVVFSDANNFYERQALRRLVQPFANPQVGATSGAKVITGGDGALGDSEGLYWRYEDFIKRQETRLGTTTGVCGEILAIRRSLYQPPPTTTINDDFYLALSLIRAGYDVIYVPEARSHERISASVEDERARRARIVAGRYQAMFRPQLWPRRPLALWQVLSHKYLRPLVPLAMVIAFLANLWALRFPRRRQGVLQGPLARTLLLAQVSFYVSAWFGARLQETQGISKLLFLPAYLVSSNGAALVGLVRFLRQSQPVTWEKVPRRGPVVAPEDEV